MESSSSPRQARAATRPVLIASASVNHPTSSHAKQQQQAKKHESRFIPPPAPGLPSDVEQLKRMTAAERVKYGYQAMKSMQLSKGSAVFKSNLPRDPYDLHEERIVTRQQLLRNQMQERRREMLIRASGDRSASASGRTHHDAGEDKSAMASPTPRTSSSRPSSRSSSWARDRTERGTYLYNWSSMPQCVPKSYIDPTPGPGAYTPALFFVGGGSS